MLRTEVSPVFMNQYIEGPEMSVDGVGHDVAGDSAQWPSPSQWPNSCVAMLHASYWLPPGVPVPVYQFSVESHRKVHPEPLVGHPPVASARWPPGPSQGL